MGAFYPDAVREVIKDEMAEPGMTEEDVRELLRKPSGQAVARPDVAVLPAHLRAPSALGAFGLLGWRRKRKRSV